MAQRDSNGRFIKGVSGNPGGRPIDQTKYLKKIDTATSLKEWRAIIMRAIADAKRGDAKARQWLGDYLLGRPTQKIDQNTKHDGSIVFKWTDDYKDDRYSNAEAP